MMGIDRPASDELAMLRDSIAEVLAARCDSSALHAFVDAKNDLSSILFKEAADLGWMAIGLDEEAGGFGLGADGNRLLHLELGRAAAPGPFLATLCAAETIARSNDESIRREWLQDITSGQASCAISALPATDAPLTTDHGSVTGKVRLLGDRGASVALFPTHDGGVVLARPAAGEITPVDFWDRTRSLFDVTYERATPLAVFRGPTALETLTRNMSIGVAADSVGIGHGIIAKTIAYLKEREQFGRPIGSFQALKHRMVDMVAKVEIAGHILDQAVSSDRERADGADMWALLAKVAATRAATFVAGDCLQMFGGVGFTWEYDVHLYLKRARMNEMLVADNRTLLDRASEALAQQTRAERNVFELALS